MTSNDGAALGAEAARRLARLGSIRIKPGLTEDEFAAAERTFGIEFADDHRAFLAAGLPTGRGWPDWRGGEEDVLRDLLTWPVEGVLFDVEHNDFWYAGWPARPGDPAGRLALAETLLADVPQLIPVCGHRYLAPGRGSWGHPVLSIYQTDIVYYGTDLVDYLYQDFGAGPGAHREDPAWQPRATVPFWRDLVT